MNPTTINAILNLLAAMLPTIEQYGAALVEDAQRILADIQAGTATPEQLAQAAQLSAQADAKQDAIYAALQAQDAADAGTTASD